MLKTALLILTLGNGGAIHMALSEAETMEDCEAKADVVGQVLTGAGYTIEAMRCGETSLALTPYKHGHSTADMRWHYHVTLKGTDLGDGFVLRPVEAGECEADGKAMEYCTISAQGPVGN